MKKILAKVTLPVLLVLACTMLSCNREAIDDNPNYNPETREVIAQFVISVSPGGEEQTETKMSAANVQKDGSFRGIQDAQILAFATGLANPFVNKTDGSNFKKIYTFPSLFAANAVTATNSRRVLEMSLDAGTDAVLVYGKAVNANPGNTTGKMEFHVSDEKPSETYFDAVRRIGDDTKIAQYDATARLMIFAINQILSSHIGTMGNADYLSWKDLGHQWETNQDPTGEKYGHAGAYKYLNALETILGQTYSTFTYIKVGATNPTSEYRAGSSNAVRFMMQGMDEVLSAVRTATPTDDAETKAVNLADEIARVMGIFFKKESTSGVWSYKDILTIKAHDSIKDKTFDFLDITDPEQPSVTQVTLNDAGWESMFGDAQDLNGYPYDDFGIPTGAAQLRFYQKDKNGTDVDMFAYKHPNAPLVNPNATSFDPKKYLYPVELAYYVNSPLRVTSSELSDNADANYPNGAGNWDTTDKWTETGKTWVANGAVSSSTRGVAVQYNVNYGVAMLETNVDWVTDATTATGKVTSLKDNKAALTGDVDDNTLTVEDGMFSLKGVLVGGVNPKMNWQFLRKNNSGDLSLFDHVIYDDVPAGNVDANGKSALIAVPTTSPNYTLVFDNYNSSGAQDKVYVALEFVNNNSAFWGRDNLIPQGGIFYLVGELDPAPAGQTITWPENNQIPPLYGVDGDSNGTAGQSMKVPRVFIQDFMTKATFRIGTHSLKNAYLSIPDLRASQMSLGLSVDLSWQNGFVYDITL